MQGKRGETIYNNLGLNDKVRHLNNSVNQDIFFKRRSVKFVTIFCIVRLAAVWFPTCKSGNAFQLFALAHRDKTKRLTSNWSISMRRTGLRGLRPSGPNRNSKGKGGGRLERESYVLAQRPYTIRINTKIRIFVVYLCITLCLTECIQYILG